MTADFVRSLKTEDVIQIRCCPTAGIPNHPTLPALFYAQAVARGAQGRDVKILYEQNGWTRTWVYTLFDFQHYHYAAHEVLTVITGSGVLELGGDQGPQQPMSEGDVVILPAGYGHKLLEADRGFTVVGGYPAGQDDTGFNHAGDDAARRAKASIAATPLPLSDPIFGAQGPLLDLWHQTSE